MCTRTGTPAISEGGVVREVGIGGQRLFVCWVGGIEPASGVIDGAVGVENGIGEDGAGRLILVWKMSLGSCHMTEDNVPVVRMKDRTLWNEIALVEIVLLQLMRNSKFCNDGSVANSLFHDCPYSG